MSKSYDLHGIYHIHKDFNEAQETFIYGIDKGALYVYEELVKKKVNVTAFCRVSAYTGEIFSGLSVIDYVKLQAEEQYTLILPVYDSKIKKRNWSSRKENIFLYSTAYQNDILWPENTDEYNNVLKPFYQVDDRLASRDIVLYGTGDIGHRLFVELLNYEIPVKYFCDDDESVIGLKLMNKLVISLTELVKLKDECNIVIASRDYVNEIENKLRLLGINNLYYYNG